MGWAVGDNGLVMRTKDGGLTWESRQVPLDCEPMCDKWGQPLESVKFVNEQLGWVVASNQVARTTDGGETWEVMSLADDNNRVVSIIGLVSQDGKRVWAVNEGEYNYFSQNAGRTWNKYAVK